MTGARRGLFDALMADVERMLTVGCVHADLSAFNVLYLGNGEYRIIDFPQAVIADTHPSGYELFQRDVTRLCQYFARYGHPRGLARPGRSNVGTGGTCGAGLAAAGGRGITHPGPLPASTRGAGCGQKQTPARSASALRAGVFYLTERPLLVAAAAPVRPAA